MILELVFDYVNDRIFLYQCVATLATFTILQTVLFIRTRKRRFQLLKFYGIPGPEPRLLDGNFGLYRVRKDEHMVDYSFRQKYGKVFGVFIGDQPTLTISDLEILKQIFFEKTSSFKERDHVFLDQTITESVLFARHERWKSMRKIMSPFFSTFKMRGDTSIQFVEESIKLMLEYIEDKFHGKTSIEIDMHSLMKSTALKLISGLAIDLPDVKVREDDIYVKSLDSFLSQADSGLIIVAIWFPFFRRILSFLSAHIEHGKTLSLIRKVLNKTIKVELENLSKPHEESPNDQHPQLIQTLIKLHHEGKLSRDEVIGNAEAILFAGYDTTSTTLVYIFWVLGKYPKIQEKLREELMAHGTESKYLKQVINETMRLYPTVMTFVTRIATENVTVGGLFIPRGVKVVYNSWLMHKDPEIWPRPEEFDPDRFHTNNKIHPCAFAPFGMSERKCLGYSLAQLELKLIVCDIVMRYRLFTKAPQELHLNTYSRILSKPKEQIVIRLEKV